MDEFERFSYLPDAATRYMVAGTNGAKLVELGARIAAAEAVCDIALPLDAAGYPSEADVDIMTLLSMLAESTRGSASVHRLWNDGLIVWEQVEADTPAESDALATMVHFICGPQATAAPEVERPKASRVKPALAALGAVQGDGRYQGLGFCAA